MSQSHGAKDILIFSVYQKTLSEEENLANHVKVMDSLHDLGIEAKLLDGMWEGVPEKSILVDAKYNDLVKALCKNYNQECYLLGVTHMHGMYKAWFIDPQGEDEDFFEGFLRSVPKDVAEKELGYSYDPSTDTYFIICDHDETNMSELKEMGWYA